MTVDHNTESVPVIDLVIEITNPDRLSPRP
jgi:hypothetical protein